MPDDKPACTCRTVLCGDLRRTFTDQEGPFVFLDGKRWVDSRPATEDERRKFDVERVATQG